MRTTFIALGILGALATSFGRSARPKALPPAPAPIAASTGAALLTPSERFDGVSSSNEYAYSPLLGWRRIVAPAIPDWAPPPSGPFSDLGPLGGTPVLELGATSPSRSSDDDPADPHPVPDGPSVTHSSFDDEDLVDHHPVSDEPTVTHSSFDDEDLVDRHPVP